MAVVETRSDTFPSRRSFLINQWKACPDRRAPGGGQILAVIGGLWFRLPELQGIKDVVEADGSRAPAWFRNRTSSCGPG